MKVTVFNSQKNLSFSANVVKKLVTYLLQEMDVLSDEIILHFVTKKKIQQLHLQHFDDPTPTDCISFPIDSPQTRGILGEIFICPKVALEYAEKKKMNPYEETTLYIVHGLLHLLGYDDLEKKAKQRMRRQEKKCLKMLSEKNLILKKSLK